MNTPMEVPQNAILEKALLIIRSANKQIRATMDLTEELQKPLPKEYFLLLEEKIKQGITLKRIAFGNKSQFIEFAQKNILDSQNYYLKLAKSNNYRRMLLIDETLLIYALNKEDGRHFYYTKDKKIINNFANYFDLQFAAALDLE